MPRRRKVAKSSTPVASTPRTTRRRKQAAESAPLPSPQDAYGHVVEAYVALWKQILVGTATPKDRADLDTARQRAQTLKDAYPTLWEKACREVDR